MFKKLEVLPPFSLVKYKTVIFMYKVFYYLVPTNISSHFTHIVCRSSYLCHSVDLFKKSEVLPPFHLVRYKTAIFIYKVFHNLVPTNILSHFTHIVCKSCYFCHSEDMFKKLEVLPLIHLVKYKTAIFMYKVFCDLVPTNILSHFTHIVCKVATCVILQTCL